MKSFWITTAACAATIAAGLTSMQAETTKSAEPSKQDVSYSIGYDIAKGMESKGVEVDPDALASAMRDVFQKKKPRLTEEQMEETMKAFSQKMQAKQASQMGEMSAKNMAEGKAYLEKFAKEPGVVVTPTGLHYKVIADGEGDKPLATDVVKVHYKGTLINGTEFDSSYKRNQPVEFPVGGVISGWTEALQMMRPGAKWKLAIPAGLAYGPQGRPGIPPGATLLFDVELLSVQKDAARKN